MDKEKVSRTSSGGFFRPLTGGNSLLKRWNLNHIILITLIAIICGVISWGSSYLYNALVLVLTPFGLKPFANEALLGLWIISGPLAAEVFRIPGAAFFSEVLTAIVETFLGNQWGVMDLIFGAVQGAGTEAGFALTGYRHYDWLGLSVAALTGTAVTFGYDLFRIGYLNYPLPLLTGLFTVRLLSLLIIGSWLPAVVVKTLKRSQFLKS